MKDQKFYCFNQSYHKQERCDKQCENCKPDISDIDEILNMNDKDIKHLEWIFGRMRDIHGERDGYDYMIRFHEIIENQKKIRDIIKLSGKLANSARLVTKSNVKNISDRIKKMEEDLNNYDSEILKLIE
jgi:hypothetical protein